MSVCQYSPSSFAKLSPISISEGGGVPPKQNDQHQRNKLLRKGLVDAYHILNTLSNSSQSSNDDQDIRLNLIAGTRSVDLLIGKTNKQRKEKTSNLMEEVKELNSSIDYTAITKNLEQLKTALITNLQNPKPENEKKGKTGLFSQLGALKKDLAPNYSQAYGLYPFVFLKCHKLRCKIDKLTKNPKPVDSVVQNIFSRINDPFLQERLSVNLAHADKKEQDRKMHFNALTKEWNKTYDKLNGIYYSIEVLDTCKEAFKTLVSIHKEAAKVKEKIDAILSKYNSCEQYLGQTFLNEKGILNEVKERSKKNISEQEFSFCEKELASLSLMINENASQIQTILESLKKTEQELSKPVDKDHQPEIQELFIETKGKALETYRTLEKEICKKWNTLQLEHKQAILDFNYFKDTYNFKHALAHSIDSFYQIARVLRHHRKEGNDFESEHQSASENWAEKYSHVVRLATSLEELKEKIKNQIKQTGIEEKKELTFGKTVLSPSELLDKEHKEKLQNTLSQLEAYWKKLEAVSSKAAQEMNRGVTAVANKSNYKDIKDAFSSETSHMLTEKASALIPGVVTSIVGTAKSLVVSAPEPVKTIYFQSPFDTGFKPLP